MKKLSMTALAVAIIASGVIGAKAFADDKEEVQLEKVRPAVQTVTEQRITLEDAKHIALNHVENGVITEAEVERERGHVVYEIEVKTNEFEHELKINQEGKIIKEEREKRDDDDKKKQQDVSAMIGVDKAKAIALNEVNGTIDDIELEREDGLYVYEVEIERDNNDDDDVTVYIDAITGKVLYVEWD